MLDFDDVFIILFCFIFLFFGIYIGIDISEKDVKENTNSCCVQSCGCKYEKI